MTAALNAGVSLHLGRDVLLRLRLPGPPRTGRRPAPIGSLASSSQRFAASLGRQPRLRQGLRGPQGVPVTRSTPMSTRPPRWWRPLPPVPQQRGAVPWWRTGRPGATAAAMPRRGLPRAVHRVPDEHSWTPGGILTGLAPEVAAVRRHAEVTAAGPMTTSHDVARLTAADTRPRASSATAPGSRPSPRAPRERSSTFLAPSRRIPPRADRPAAGSHRPAAPNAAGEASEAAPAPVAPGPAEPPPAPAAPAWRPARASRLDAARVAVPLGAHRASAPSAAAPHPVRVPRLHLTLGRYAALSIAAAPTTSAARRGSAPIRRPAGRPVAPALRIRTALPRLPALPSLTRLVNADLSRLGSSRRSRPAGTGGAGATGATGTTGATGATGTTGATGATGATGTTGTPWAPARPASGGAPAASGIRLGTARLPAALLVPASARAEAGAAEVSTAPIPVSGRQSPASTTASGGRPLLGAHRAAAGAAPVAAAAMRPAPPAVPIRPRPNLEVARRPPSAPRVPGALRASVGGTRRELRAAAARTQTVAMRELFVTREAARRGAARRRAALGSAFGAVAEIRPATTTGDATQERPVAAGTSSLIGAHRGTAGPAPQRPAGPAPHRPAERAAPPARPGASLARFGQEARHAAAAVRRLLPAPPRISLNITRPAAPSRRASGADPVAPRLVPGPDGRLRPSLIDTTAALFAAKFGRDHPAHVQPTGQGGPMTASQTGSQLAAGADSRSRERSVLDDPRALQELTDRIVDRIEARVIDELERRGRRHTPEAF